MKALIEQTAGRQKLEPTIKGAWQMYDPFSELKQVLPLFDFGQKNGFCVADDFVIDENSYFQRKLLPKEPEPWYQQDASGNLIYRKGPMLMHLDHSFRRTLEEGALHKDQPHFHAFFADGEQQPAFLLFHANLYTHLGDDLFCILQHTATNRFKLVRIISGAQYCKQHQWRSLQLPLPPASLPVPPRFFVDAAEVVFNRSWEVRTVPAIFQCPAGAVCEHPASL